MSSPCVIRISRSLPLSRPAVSSPRSSQAHAYAQALKKESSTPLLQMSCISAPRETRERERHSIPLVRRRGLRQTTTIPATAAGAATPSTSTSNSNGTGSSKSEEKRFDAVALGNICVDIFIPVDEIPPQHVVKTHATLRRLQGAVAASVAAGLDGSGSGSGGGEDRGSERESSGGRTATMTMTMTGKPSTSAAAVPTRLELGGNANFLIAAARLGLRTAAVAHVGEDAIGEFAARELEREGVEVLRPPLLGRGVEVPLDDAEIEESSTSSPSSSSSSSVLLGREDTLVCYVLTHAESASHAFCSAYDLGPHPLLVSRSSSSASSLSSSSSAASAAPEADFERRSAGDEEGDKNAASSSSSSPSAQHPLLPQAALDVLSSTRAVFVNGFAFDELPAGTVLAALGAARAAGALVFFDPGPRVAAMLSSSSSFASSAAASSGAASASESSTALLEAALDAADVVLLTEEEAEAATGVRVAGLGSDAAAEAARAILRCRQRGGKGRDGRRRGRRTTSAVVVKRGAKGAVAVVVAGGGSEQDEEEEEEGGGSGLETLVFERAAPSVAVVDTVGCGDSFAAAFVLASVVGGASGGEGVSPSTSSSSSSSSSPRPSPLPVALALANAVGAATASASGAGRAVACPEIVVRLLERDASGGDGDAVAALELLRRSRERNRESRCMTPRPSGGGPLDTATAVSAPAPAFEIDAAALASYLLRSNVLPASPDSQPLRVLKFTHGQSNPTYLLQAGPSWRAVLRKKPPGVTLPSAHAVEREAALLLGLGEDSSSSPPSSSSSSPSPFRVPVPRVLALETSERPLGTPFYVMEFVAGRVFADPALPGLLGGGKGEGGARERRALYAAAAEALAKIHSVDVRASRGLSELLLPPSKGTSGGANYCARQIQRWERQYLAQAGFGTKRPLLPEMLELAAFLKSHVPAADASLGDSGGRPTLVHGDFRMDNLVFDYRSPTVLAVLDWELATTGSALADAAYATLPWHLPPGVPALPSLPQSPGKLPRGLPTEREFREMYFSARERLLAAAAQQQQERGGAPPPPPRLRRPGEREWAFYVALALFRAAAILSGVGARAEEGNAASAGARAAGGQEVVRALATRALAVVDGACGGGGARGPSAEAPLSPSASPPPPPAPAGLGPSPRAAAILSELRAFMRDRVAPHEAVADAHFRSADRWHPIPGLEGLKSEARARGLWNLWLPRELAERVRATLLPPPPPAPPSSSSSQPAGSGPDLVPLAADDDPTLWGPGLSNLDYAHLAQEMGGTPWSAEVFNCSAPDTGNMEVLARCGDAAQQRAWLVPLLRGEIRSCFAMTEPAVASSDATNMEATIRFEREGGEGSGTGCGIGGGKGGIVLNGTKWWTSGALDARCRLCIFMGRDVVVASEGDSTPPPPPKHRRHSMVLVPMPSPGLTVRRALSVFGYDDAPHGHAEVTFEDVALPLDSVVLGRGRGFEIAQARLGPGRLHHCMRLVGAGERALALAAARARARRAFGGRLSDLGGLRSDLARARVGLDGARLLVLHAAHVLDAAGGDARAARGALAAAKVAAPRAATAALDVAVQIHGGAGVSQDTPLAALWAGARTLRLADGPDEVHLGTIAGLELRRSRDSEEEEEQGGDRSRL